MKRLRELLNHSGDNYIMPFFWLHGESHDILEEELDKIQACGIREVCLESRPHPDFMGPQWWSDLDFIIDQAKKRDMRVWVLDDDKFPTGHANGAYVTYLDKKKIYLAKRHMDLLGPQEDGAVLIENFLGDDGQLLAALVCPRPDGNKLDLTLENIMDVTESYRDGMIYFDIPEGFSRLVILYTTRKNGGREDYINLIDSESVKVLIDEVYERHYKRYKDEFGKSFAGFFSDEPELGNVPGYGFDELIGSKDRHLPWSQELFDLLQEEWKEDNYKNLVGLWYGLGQATGAIRKTYMDQVTYLVDRCFGGQIGQWCRDHHVEYIGHVIEDDNAHTRLGCSVGHYFRGQKGQDMAGVDLVHLQLIPGFKEKYHQWIASDRDGEFFHFGLAKLGASLARLDPKKKGRSLCEIFGSYGWAEGVGLMKWLTDHMLIRGINHFVPHAFSPLFPDRDCPPHFYGRGNNPQYTYFMQLMGHMNRMAHLLNGGYMDSGVGVLYHAEAEWSGGDYEPYQKILRLLAENQMDATVIPMDYLVDELVSFERGKFLINGLEYRALIIPYAQYIPDELINFVSQAYKWDIPLYVTGGHPQSTIKGMELGEDWYRQVQVFEGDFSKLSSGQIEVLSKEEDLRAGLYHQPDGQIYMFFNEHPFKDISTQVRLKAVKSRELYRYDSITNQLEKGNVRGDLLNLVLAPGQMAVYVCVEPLAEILQDISRGSHQGSRQDISQDIHQGIPQEISAYGLSSLVHLQGDWKISIQEAGLGYEFEELTYIKSQDIFPSINRMEGMTRFSGTIRYESHIPWTQSLCDYKGKRCFLELPGVSDGASVKINGLDVGSILSAPYHIEVTGLIKQGMNTITIDVVNTLTWRIHDGQSTHTQLKPTGMIKRPLIKVYQLTEEVK